MNKTGTQKAYPEKWVELFSVSEKRAVHKRQAKTSRGGDGPTSSNRKDKA